MSADSLTPLSRSFFEWAKGKLVVSMLVGAVCLTALGFCSLAGGISNYANQNRYSLHDDHVKNGNTAISAGFGGFSSFLNTSTYYPFVSDVLLSGFASFLYFCSFVIFFSAAIFVSPLCCGSGDERKSIRFPQEVYSGLGGSVFYRLPTYM